VHVGVRVHGGLADRERRGGAEAAGGVGFDAVVAQGEIPEGDADEACVVEGGAVADLAGGIDEAEFAGAGERGFKAGFVCAGRIGAGDEAAGGEVAGDGAVACFAGGDVGELGFELEFEGGVVGGEAGVADAGFD
jgi:hypothetical protein